MDPILEEQLSPDEQARAKFLEDFASLMGEAPFRRWLWHLIEQPTWAGSFHYGADFAQPNRMYFLEGKRELGMLLNQTAMAQGNENYRRMRIEAENLKLQRELKHEQRLKAQQG